MRSRWTIFVVLATTLALAWAAEWRLATRRRGELASLRVQVAEKDRRQNEQTRLAAQVAATELARLRAERDEVVQLRGELDRLRRRAEARAREAAATGSSQPAPGHAPTMTEDFVPCAEWKNMGQATPSDALQTALWAAAGGDLKTLAAAILLDPAAREKAHRLLDRLPREATTQFRTAEDFLALLTTKDVPLSEAHLVAPETSVPAGMAVRVAEFRDSTGKMRSAPIVLRQVAEKEWRLVVPETAVDKYAALLSLPPSEARTN